MKKIFLLFLFLMGCSTPQPIIKTKIVYVPNCFEYVGSRKFDSMFNPDWASLRIKVNDRVSLQYYINANTQEIIERIFLKESGTEEFRTYYFTYSGKFCSGKYYHSYALPADVFKSTTVFGFQ